MRTGSRETGVLPGWGPYASTSYASEAPRTTSVRLYIERIAEIATAEDTVYGVKLQECQRFTVDSRTGRAVSSRLRFTLMPHSFTSFVFAPNASYWWWYRTANEEAAASV